MPVSAGASFSQTASSLIRRLVALRDEEAADDDDGVPAAGDCGPLFDIGRFLRVVYVNMV